MTRLAVLIALFPVMALAAPPPETDLNSSLHWWFERQHSIHGAWCCDLSDGHLLDDQDWRAVGAGYEVRIAGVWFPVAESAMRDPSGGENPTGHAIVWYTIPPRGGAPTIYCFAPGTLY